MRSYSRDFKEAMVQKLCIPGAPSALQLSRDTGIPSQNLNRWVKELGGPVSKRKSSSVNWDPAAKLQAVFDVQGLDELSLGKYLREKGLHLNQLEEWKSEALATVANFKKQGRPRKDPQLVAAEKEIIDLKRDLLRKEKALAEQTAIVILQKKARELWGQDEDDV